MCLHGAARTSMANGTAEGSRSLVRARTMIVNALRGLVKSAGGRRPACSLRGFETRTAASIPPALATAARPLLNQIAELNAGIQQMDRSIEQLAGRYPKFKILRTVPGIGPLITAAYILTLDRPDAVQHSRQSGAFLGLRPRQSQSGD